MKGIVLGVDRLGMVGHVAGCMSKLGFESICCLVNRPELLASEVASIPCARTGYIANPYDHQEIARAAVEFAGDLSDTIFLCVQDRLTLAYLAGLELLFPVGLGRCIPCRGIRAARLKPTARRLWNEHSVDPTRWTVVCRDEGRSRYWQNIGRLPRNERQSYVLKPVAGVGSAGVVRAHGWSEVLARLGDVRRIIEADLERSKTSVIRQLFADGAELRLFEDVLVEEALDGPEFVVDGCIRNGSVDCIVQHKESRWTGSFFGDGLICSPPDLGWNPEKAVFSKYSPSPSFRSLNSEFVKFLEHGLAALGLDNWAFHAEVLEHDGRLRFVEVNPRGGGGLLWKTAGRRMGIDPFDMCVHLAAGVHFNCRERTDIVTGQFPIYAFRKGTVLSVDGVAFAREEQAIVEVTDVVGHVEGGLKVQDTLKENYLAFVRLEGPNHETVRNAALEAFRVLRPRYEDG